MTWIETERHAVVNMVMNIQFQKSGHFLDCLRTCWLLQQHCAVWHCINRTVQTVRRQKAVPYRTDSSHFLLPDLQLCSFSQHSALQSALFSSQHSALQSALFLQSTLRSPVRFVTSHRTDDAVTVTVTVMFLQTSTFFSTPNPYSYFAGLSLREPPVDRQSLHVGTVVQQQQYLLSAANRSRFYITFRPSFAMFRCFCCQ